VVAVDVAIAFAAGVISFFSPCSVSVLPAFIAYYVGRRDEDAPDAIPLPRTPRMFLAGLGLDLLGGGLGVGALAHNFVDLDRNRVVDIVAGLIGLALLSIGLVLLIAAHRALEPSTRQAFRTSARRGVTFGLLATVGSAIVYGGIGLLVAASLSGLGTVGATAALESSLPWVSLLTALAIIVLGILLAVDRSPFSYIPALRAPRARNSLAFLLFGAAYALISTSCLLPVFLSVLFRAFSLSPMEAIVVFLAMAAGSGLLMTLTATYVALAKHIAFRTLRRFRRYVKPVAGGLVILFALYTVYYDLVTFFGVG